MANKATEYKARMAEALKELNAMYAHGGQFCYDSTNKEECRGCMRRFRRVKKLLDVKPDGK